MAHTHTENRKRGGRERNTCPESPTGTPFSVVYLEGIVLIISIIPTRTQDELEKVTTLELAHEWFGNSPEEDVNISTIYTAYCLFKFLTIVRETYNIQLSVSINQVHN